MISVRVKSSGFLGFKKYTDDLIEAGAKELVRKIFQYSVQLSPVRTGSFRASWRVAYNTPDRSVTNWPIPDFPIAGAKFEWPAGFKVGDTIHITNSQPYADALEHGWSNQRPQGILRLAVTMAKVL